jgi:uncharacterized membrane protein YphA (DoxX/SURF4 family)
MTAAHHLLAGATGLFFAISGFHKTFHAPRRASLRDTLTRLRIPLVGINLWLVAVTELVAGAILTLGLGGILHDLCTVALLAICIVACGTDGLAKIREWKPINAADWFDTLLYLPETVYALVLVALILPPT